MPDHPFIPPIAPEFELPLGRFLPPLPYGMLSTWLQDSIAPGSWLIDPLAANPLVALESAQAGYNVLATSNNPILAIILEVLASAPKSEDFNSALTRLADSKRGDERLEVHLQSLYLSPCPDCNQLVPASAFLWKKDEPKPIARYLKCRFCQKEGEYPITQDDLQRYSIPGSRQLLQSRAYERIGVSFQQPKEAAREAVEAYLERPLYVLFTIINKIEGLAISAEQKQLLIALTITACDEGNSLWPHTGGRTRPRLISIPGEFWERNLWMAMEDAISIWTKWTDKIELTRWPDIPHGRSGITLYPGRFNSITNFPEGLVPKAIVSAIPYPNQAFWTLSAVWSGWLWGKQAVTPLRVALDRQRYDSHWLASALTSAFGALPSVLPFFALVPELAPSFLQAIILAGQAVGLKMQGLAIAPARNLAQVHWETGFRSRMPMPVNLTHFCRDAIQVDLEKRNEPASYLHLTAAVLTHLLDLEIFPSGSPGVASEMLNKVQGAMKDATEDRNFLMTYGSRDPDSQGLWWLKEPPAGEPSLADRIELTIQEILRSEVSIEKLELEKILYSQFPGLLTPSLVLVEACLESYAEEQQDQPGFWKLKSQETSEARQKDLNDARIRVNTLGKSLGFEVRENEYVKWMKSDKVDSCFFFFDSCAFGSRLDFMEGNEIGSRVIVFPGSRAELLIQKMQRDPNLEERLKPWHLLKLRYLRQLAERDPLTLPIWKTLLDGDPLLWEKAEQMPIFKS